MLLTSPDSTFRLTILGYQHPDAAGEPYDANWLSIHVEAAGPGGAWTGTDPCLLTYEVVRLADWLDAVAAGNVLPVGQPAPPPAAATRPAGAARPQAAPAPRAISFLEPALLFRLVESPAGVALRVHFGNLVNPSWRSLEGRQRPANPDLSLDFPLETANLPAAAEALRQEVRRYPNRAED
jgi:hypothetical protein